MENMSTEKPLEPVKLYRQFYEPNNCNAELPPIVFVHGLSTSSSSWTKVMFKIADRTKRKVYAVDLRNHGNNEWTDVFNLDALMTDLEHFLKQEGIKEVILVGHSLGGLAAGCVAMHQPSVVSKLIVEDHAFTIPSDMINQSIEILNALKNICKLPKHYTEKEAGQLIGRFVNSRFPGAFEYHYMPLRRDADGKFEVVFNIDAATKSLEDGSLIKIDSKKCQQYTGPALFIYGGKSVVRVADDDLIPKYFPNVQFSEFPKASHMPHTEFPDEYIEKVANFINN